MSQQKTPIAQAIRHIYQPDELLLPYQKAWLEDDSVLKIAEKSRRTGLTWAEAADAVMAASKKRAAGGTNHFYVGSNKEMAIEFIDACAYWAKAFNDIAVDIEEEIFTDKDKDILTFNIKFASGFKIQALSSNPSNLRGRQGNVTIDEAAFHERLAEVLKAASALTMWGAKVRLISTHNGYENLFNEIIQDSRAKKRRYSVHRVTLDDACEQGLYQRICQIRGKEWSQDAEDIWKEELLSDTATQEDALEEYYCQPKQGGGSYLSRGLIESRMNADSPVLRYDGSAEFNTWAEPIREAEIRDWCEINLLPLLKNLDQTTRHSFGEDFGRTGDLTVLVPMEVSQNLQRSIPFMVELRNVPFKQQEQIVNYIIDRLPMFMGGAFDARGNGQYIAEQAKYRYGAAKIQEVMITQGWYLEIMPRLKAAFEDAEILISKDMDVLNDLRAIQVIKGIPKIPDGNTGSKTAKRHGDAAVAIAMAYFASLMEFEEFAYEAINQKTKDSPSQFKTTTFGGGKRGLL